MNECQFIIIIPCPPPVAVPAPVLTKTFKYNLHIVVMHNISVIISESGSTRLEIGEGIDK
jgi:hypothetical protein